MAFRTRLLGLDDDLLDNLPSVAATTDAMGRAVDAGMGAAVAPPTPIDPWEDEPAQTAPGLSLHLSRPMQAPSRSLLGMDFEIPEPVSKRFETAGEARPRMTTAPQTLAPIPRRLAAPTGAVEAAPERLSMMSAADDAVAEPVPEAVGRGARMVAPVAYESLEGLDDSAQPEAAPQNKGLPGLSGFDPFGTTADESKALERAGTFDRRMGIARGAMQLLGGLGGIVGGATGVHGIGAAGQGLSAGGSAPIDSMRDTVQGRITQRQAQDMRRMQYGQAQEDRALQREDRTLARERQASQDALNTEYRRAQIGNIGAQAEERRIQIEGEQSNANALREFIRANVLSLDPRNPTRARWEAMMSRPGFETSTSEALMQIDDSMGGILRTRAFANSGGRIGSSSSSNTAVDPVTGQRVRVRTGGGGGGGGGAPRPAGGGGPAPAPVPSGPVPPTGAPLDVSEDSLTETIAAGMRAEGLDPTSESGRAMLRAEVATLLHGPSAGAQSDPLADARERLRQRAIADIGGLPPGVTEQSLARIPPEAVKHRAVSDAYERFLSRVDGYHNEHPAEFQLAVSMADVQDGPGATISDQLAFRIRQDLQNQINSVLSRISGANVTPNEMERNLRALGVGTFATNYGVVRQAFADRQNEVDDMVIGYLARVDPRTADYWLGMAPSAAAAVVAAPAAAPVAGPAATGGQ